MENIYRLKVKVWKKKSHARGDLKKAGVSILISDKIHFKKTVIRNKQKHCTKIKGSLQ